MLKKVAAVNDLSGIGKCSLTVALPILSALKVQCCPLPTAILSSQTGFSQYTFLDLTGEMERYARTWKNLNLNIDTIYSGFLGSINQIDIVSRFIEEWPNACVMVDPVLGDNGLLFPIFSGDTCSKMRELVRHAHLITPNITEACLLLDKKYSPNFSDEELETIAKKLSNEGPAQVIITGIIRGDMIYNLAYDRKNGNPFLYGMEYNRRSYSGTGDIFASIVCALVTNGHSIEFAVKTASDFIYKCVSFTALHENDRNQGVMFEMFLHDLTLIDSQK